MNLKPSPSNKSKFCALIPRHTSVKAAKAEVAKAEAKIKAEVDVKVKAAAEAKAKAEVAAEAKAEAKVVDEEAVKVKAAAKAKAVETVVTEANTKIKAATEARVKATAIAKKVKAEDKAAAAATVKAAAEAAVDANIAVAIENTAVKDPEAAKIKVKAEALVNKYQAKANTKARAAAAKAEALEKAEAEAAAKTEAAFKAAAEAIAKIKVVNNDMNYIDAEFEIATKAEAEAKAEVEAEAKVAAAVKALEKAETNADKAAIETKAAAKAVTVAVEDLVDTNIVTVIEVAVAKALEEAVAKDKDLETDKAAITKDLEAAEEAETVAKAVEEAKAEAVRAEAMSANLEAAIKTKTNGYLANAIRSDGSENDSKEIFARIDSRTKEEKSGAWGQVKAAYTKYSADSNSLGDYTDNEKGGFIGYDRYIAQEKLPGKLMLGAYTKVNGHDMSQGSTDKGNITNAGAGVYGSYEEEKWEVKATISGSHDMYNNNEREVSISRGNDNVDKTIVKAKDFTGGGIGCNLEGALKVKLSNKFNLRPYLGLDARRSYYGSIEEKSSGKKLDVNTGSGNYDRAFAKTGLVVEQKIGKFGWNVNAEYKRLLSNNLPKIVSSFTFEGLEGEIADIGTKEGKDVLGAGVGGSYNITENVSIFANIDILAAERYQNAKANLGANYRF